MFKFNLTYREDHFDELLKNVKELNGKKLHVGVMGEREKIAMVHEFGCRIPVTPKMRAFLAANGIYLKPSKTSIVIPERAFLRTGFDKGFNNVKSGTNQSLQYAMFGKITVSGYTRIFGAKIVSAIKKNAISIKYPPNVWTRSTIDSPLAKGSSNPLVDTGQMIDEIDYKVEG